MTDGKSFTTRGAEAWKIEYDRSGVMLAEWAEKILLGTLLINFQKHAADLLEFESTAFRSEFHRAIFDAMIDLENESYPVNVVSVAERLQELNKLSIVENGVAYLAELMDQSEGRTGDHISEWCRSITRKAAVEKFKQEITAIDRLVTSEPDIDVLQARVISLAECLPQRRRSRETTISEATAAYVESLSIGQTETSRWGIPELDAATGGVALGEMVIIGARPSHGKTALALQWLDTAADVGVPSLIISEEMSAASLAKRQLQRIMPSDVASDMQRMRFEVRQHFEHRAPVIVAESVGKIGAAERVIERAVKHNGIKIVAVDYAQLLKGDGNTKYEQVSDVSTRMKRIATKFQIVVLLLAQLNRSLESRQDATPQLSDLKDSGQLEQDGDVILFPFWPVKIKADYPNPNEYRIYQAKNRNRGIGQAIVVLNFDPTRQRFTSQQSEWDDRIDRSFT